MATNQWLSKRNYKIFTRIEFVNKQVWISHLFEKLHVIRFQFLQIYCNYVWIAIDL